MPGRGSGRGCGEHPSHAPSAVIYEQRAPAHPRVWYGASSVGRSEGRMSMSHCPSKRIEASADGCQPARNRRFEKLMLASRLVLARFWVWPIALACCFERPFSRRRQSPDAMQSNRRRSFSIACSTRGPLPLVDRLVDPLHSTLSFAARVARSFIEVGLTCATAKMPPGCARLLATGAAHRSRCTDHAPHCKCSKGTCAARRIALQQVHRQTDNEESTLPNQVTSAWGVQGLHSARFVIRS